RRDQEAEGEGARRCCTLPAELGKDGREEQRKCGARVDADAHRHEDDRDDQPAVEKGKTHGTMKKVFAEIGEGWERIGRWFCACRGAGALVAGRPIYPCAGRMHDLWLLAGEGLLDVPGTLPAS